MAGETYAHPLRSDTLTLEASRGRPLVTVLPDSAHGRPILRYEPLSLPATGWLVDRSFFWRIPPSLPSDRYTFLLRRHMAGLPPDTLYLIVRIQ